MRFASTLFLFCLTLLSSLAQEVDSLGIVMKKQSGADKMKTLLTLGNKTFYADPEKARSFAKEALDISKSLRDLEGEIDASRIIGITYDIEGVRDSAKYYFQRFSTLSHEMKDKGRIAASHNLLGMWYWNGGLFQEALEYYFQAIEASEKAGEVQTLASALNNTGLIYQELKNYPLAKNYHLQALSIRESNQWLQGVVHSCNNLGICFKNLDMLDSAARYYMKGLEIATQLDDRLSVAKIQQNSGVIAMLKGEYDLAIELVNRSLTYKEEALGNLLSYSTLSEIYHKIGRADLSIAYGLKALEIAERIGIKGHRRDVYSNLTAAYILAGNRQKAQEYFEKSNKLRDEIFSVESAKAYNDLQVRYETLKKEQKIAQQNTEITQRELELAQSRTLLAVSVVLLTLLISTALLLRIRWRKTQEIKRHESEVKAKQKEIALTISSQEQERARYARDLHDGLGQMISLLNISLGKLQNSESTSANEEILKSSEKVVQNMTQELRNTCFNLMPQTLVKGGLGKALKELASRVNQMNELKVELNIFGIDSRLPKPFEISLYRIIQEWLNNIIKHSNASHVTIHLTADEKEVTLLIEDNGAGFNKELLLEGRGNGWLNMTTRAELVRGTLELDTDEGRSGTSLILNAPLDFEETTEENTLPVV